MKTLFIPLLVAVSAIADRAQTTPTAQAETPAPSAIAIPARPALKTDRIITGTVLDFDTRTPVFNVKVRAKGSDVEATTDENGQYALRVSNADRATLYFQHGSYVPLMRRTADARIVNARMWRGHNWKLDSIMSVTWWLGPQPAVAGFRGR